MLVGQKTLLKLMIYYLLILVLGCLYLINKDYQFINLDQLIKTYFSNQPSATKTVGPNQPVDLQQLRTKISARQYPNDHELSKEQQYWQTQQQSSYNQQSLPDLYYLQQNQSRAIGYVEYRQIRNKHHYVESKNGLIYELKQKMYQIEDWVSTEYVRLRKTRNSLMQMLVGNKQTIQNDRLKINKSANDVCKQSDIRSDYIPMNNGGYIEITAIQSKNNYRLKQKQFKQGKDGQDR